MARPPRIRKSVAALLCENARHDWSIEEISVELAARGINADFSSVYRAVETLVRAGSLRRVELGTAGSRFEAATEHHEHIRCERCGAIAGVPGCAVSEAIPEVERVTGFAVTGHDLLFHGVCATCAEDQRRAG